jgi:hypothetical protein
MALGADDSAGSGLGINQQLNELGQSQGLEDMVGNQVVEDGREKILDTCIDQRELEIVMFEVEECTG